MKTIPLKLPLSGKEKKEFILKPFVKVIFGMRGCGKREFLQELKGGIIDEALRAREDDDIEKRVHEIDLEREGFNVDALIEKMADGKRHYFFLYEPHKVREWEKTVEFLSLKNADIYITSSNMSISDELKKLGSRALCFELFSQELPLLQHNLPRYCTPQILKGMLSAALIHDAAIPHAVKSMELLQNIVAYLQENITKPVSSVAAAKLFKERYRKSADEATIVSYIHHLEDAFIIKRVHGMNLKKRVQLESAKYYFTHPSLILGECEKDERIVQNAILNKLHAHGYEVYFAADIDFIAKKKGSSTLFIQASSKIFTDEDYEREVVPLKQVFDGGRKLVIGTDAFATETDGEIEHFHLKDFFLI